MKIKSIILIAIILLTASSFCISQTDTTQTVGRHYFGINGGATTGIGLTYRYMPAKWGFQASYLPFYPTEDFVSIASFSIIKNFWSGKKAGFNLYEAQTVLIDVRLDSNTTDAAGSFGFGTMAEVNFGSNIVMTINGGFCVITDLSGDFFGNTDWLIIPDFGIGFFYRI